MAKSFSPAALAAACILAPLPAAALTADEVWESWQSLSEAQGQTLTAETARQGDTLTLTGVTSETEVPDGKVTTRVDRIDLTEEDDGSVRIVPSDATIEGSFDPADGPPGSFTAQVSTAGLDLVASGAADAIAYDVAAETIELTALQVTEDGTEMPVDATVTMTGMSGHYATESGDMPMIETKLQLDALTVALDGEKPETGESVDLDVTYSDVSAQSRGNMATLLAAGDPHALVTPGATAAATLGFRKSVTALDASSEEGSFSYAAESGEGTTEFGLSDGSLTARTSANAVAVTVSGSQIPLPEVSFGLEQLEFGLTLPLAESDEPRDFGLRFNLSGLSVSDMLWSMVDPQGMLPHDPATVRIDLEGRAKLLSDLTAAAPGGPPPAVLENLSLKDLVVSVGGAELTGDGEVSFQQQNPDDIPRPDGEVQLHLTGANGLLDKLVNMGMVPEQQANGARMMMGMFGESTGEDQLRSTISFAPDGSISANGQRLR